MCTQPINSPPPPTHPLQEHSRYLLSCGFILLTRTTQGQHSCVLRLLMQNFFEMMFICWIDDKSSCRDKTRRLATPRHLGPLSLEKHQKHDAVGSLLRPRHLIFQKNSPSLKSLAAESHFCSASLFPRSNKAGLVYE